MTKICIVLGTRPEIIKLSPIIRACEKKEVDYFIIHTGQHYDKNLGEIFFDELELNKPKYNLKIGSCSHGKQIGRMIEKIEEILLEEKPSVVLVQGDTNSVLAGALAANKLNIKVGHIEAGLRSYDKSMPEEHNRVITDHISDYLFIPTKESAENVKKENIVDEKLFIVGNTIVDAVEQNKVIAEKTKDVLTKLNIEEEYILTTAHRAENVDNPTRLKKMSEGLNKVTTELNMPIIFPIHPRTKKRMEEQNIQLHNNIKIIEPEGYLEFLQLMQKAKVILTDSGGIQEEASTLKVPCVTLRDNTERPETITLGCNKLAGVEPESVVAATKEMISKTRDWTSPYGDGKTAERIIEVVTQ